METREHLKFADIPQEDLSAGDGNPVQPPPLEEQEARKLEEQKFYDRVLAITGAGEPGEVDTSDYHFLTDFAILTITFTVYRELQANTFFTQDSTTDPEEDTEELRESRDRLKVLQAYETRGKFRPCQIYPVVLRSVIGYYASIGNHYYNDTIEQRRYDQVPIGLNDKAYAIVCNSIRRLVEEQIKVDESKEEGEESKE